MRGGVDENQTGARVKQSPDLAERRFQRSRDRGDLAADPGDKAFIQDVFFDFLNLRDRHDVVDGSGKPPERASLTEGAFGRRADLSILTRGQAAIVRLPHVFPFCIRKKKARLTILRAPEAGVVQQLQANTIGGVVEPAAPLMVLVPQGGDLILEVRVLNKDIGFVREGQTVEVKLEAYPFTRYGVVDGVVEHIGKDAVDVENEGLIFPARVRLLQPSIDLGGRRTALAPGMAATAEIRTGSRRIIEFLLSPLQRRAAEAERER